MSESELSKPAVVFAPHPDDETLGCGGTIICKRHRGAPLHIVFVTNGSAGGGARNAAALGPTRMQEGLAAAAVLGVTPANVRFLGFEDGRLAEHRAALQQAVDEVIAELRPGQVFAPCPWEGTPDHDSTSYAIRAALARGSPHSITLHEYPIWFWHRWPWVASESPRRYRSFVRGLIGGWRLLRDFQIAVEVSHVTTIKQDALARHATQLEPSAGAAGQSSLRDVGGGAFLTMLLRDHEIFTARQYA